MDHVRCHTLCRSQGNFVSHLMFDTGRQTLIEIYVSRTIKSTERPINVKISHQHSPEFVYCDSHWKCISYKWDSPSRQCPPHRGCSGGGWDLCIVAQHKRRDLCHQTVHLIDHMQFSSRLLWSKRTHGVGRTAYSCCVPGGGHLPHNVGEVVLRTDLIRRCSKQKANNNKLYWTEFFCVCVWNKLWNTMDVVVPVPIYSPGHLFSLQRRTSSRSPGQGCPPKKGP